MQNILTELPDDNRRTAWLFLLIITAYVIVGLFFFSIIMAAGVLMLMIGFDIDVLMGIQSNPVAHPEARTPLLVVQGISTLGAFILAPVAFIRLNLKKRIATFFPSISLQVLGMTFVIVFCFMIVNTVFISWNQGWVFPDFMSGFENWAQGQEQKLAELTEYLTAFDSFGQFALALLVIAVLPGIGEELLFRGIIQNLFHKTLGNPHLAIWISAFIFGAIHIQFYGMVPRMLLGALFGYLYLYSGNLSIAMFAHFVNNALAVIMVYAYRQGSIEIDPSDASAVPDWYVIAVFAIIGGAGLYWFIKKHRADGQLAGGL